MHCTPGAIPDAAQSGGEKEYLQYFIESSS